MTVIKRLAFVGIALALSGCTISVPAPNAQAPQTATPQQVAVQTVIVVASPTSAPQAAGGQTQSQAQPAGGQTQSQAQATPEQQQGTDIFGTVEPTQAPRQTEPTARTQQVAPTRPAIGNSGTSNISGSSGSSTPETSSSGSVQIDGSLAGVPRVIEDRDASYIYSVGVVGKDANGAPVSENVKVEMYNFPDQNERLMRLSGANLPVLQRKSDNESFRMGLFEFYARGEKSYLLAELPNGDRVCAELASSDTELLLSLSPRLVLPKVEQNIAALINNPTTVMDESVDGMAVKTYIAVNSSGEVLSASVTDAGELVKVAGSFSGAYDFFGQQVEGNMLVDFETRLSGLNPITLPAECQSAPSTDYNLIKPTTNM